MQLRTRIVLHAALIAVGFGLVCNAYIWTMGPSGNHFLPFGSRIELILLSPYGVTLPLLFSFPLALPRLLERTALTRVLAWATFPILAFQFYPYVHFVD